MSDVVSRRSLPTEMLQKMRQDRGVMVCTRSFELQSSIKYNFNGELTGYIKDKKFQNVRIWYLSPKEIIESVGTGVLDAGIGALDLLKNSEPNIQSRISIEKKYEFGQCQLCVLLPKFWLDTVNPTDLEEVSWEFFYKKKNF